MNLDQWLADWSQYMPSFVPEDIESAKIVGKLAKEKNVWDILKNVNQAGADIDKFLHRGDSSKVQNIYDSALATGRLSDFQTSSNIWDIEQGYVSDVYNSLGEMAGAGAFDWGNVNEGDYFQSTVDPGGGDGDDESSPYCASICAAACIDVNDDACADCYNDCLNP